MFALKKKNSDLNLIKNSPIFDREWYLATYSDVKNSNISPEEHYLKYGFKLGYNPSVFFDTNYYFEKILT